MRKRAKIIAAVAAVAVIGILIWAYMAFNRKEGDIEAGNPTTVTPEATPTDTVMPTGGAAVTPEGTPTPVPELTDTPEATKAPEPTDMPTPTLTPAPSREPEPSFTPTPSAMPTPEPSKEPTAAPEATKAPVGKPTPTPLVEYKKDGVDVPIVQTFQVSDTTYVYIYENGKLAVADSGTGYSKRYATNYKDPANVDIAMVIDCLLVDEAAALQERKITINPSLMPTPIPTPTPFPTPNPEKPKMLASYKGDKDYGDITVEAWDNGYLYVKGTGVLNKYFSMSYLPQDLKDYWEIGKASGVEVTHVIIGEGITGIRNFPYAAGKRDERETIQYIEFPSTLTRITYEEFDFHFVQDVKITGYKSGEKTTVILKSDGNIISDLDSLYDVIIKSFDIGTGRDPYTGEYDW